MFQKILIANRGEIAVRIIRACREMGIKTVAVYSEADRDALHTLLADEAICIGPAPSTESYLDMERILTACVVMKADAIHPGFGFLSENARFAELCEKCNIRFIGPSAEIINKMGNKSEARKTMMAAGVPVVPGSKEPVYTVEEGLKTAKEVGFPVMIKASSGGGGKGMRVSRSEEDFEANFLNAQMESVKGFSDNTMYIERFVENPRHIEFQILGDRYGNVVHLGERDCSIQRRHQKVLEESPSAAISGELRKKMGETAVRAAKAVGYENAGTIEFLLDKDKNFYFMEMNTRIQVEHPVTVRVPIGTTIEEVVALAGGTTVKDPVYFIGGPMMGFIGSGSQPVTKTTNAVLVLPQDHYLVKRKRSKSSIDMKRAAACCCQCSMCTDLCPRHLLGHPIQPHLFMRAATCKDVQQPNIFINTFFCCSCGVCELYSCPQELSPRTLMLEYKNGLRANGLRAPEVTAVPVGEERSYRRVPMERLMSRLDLTKYNKEAPLDESVIPVKRVKIMLSQHIGAPASCVVKPGDMVVKGQMIAEPAKGLSVGIHASVNGLVSEVNEKYVVIETQEGRADNE